MGEHYINVNDVNDYESGTMDEHRQVSFIQSMIDSGAWLQMQGSYGRTAHELIQAGRCMLPPERQTDYYGNPIPSRNDVPAGAPGSPQYVEQQTGASG